MADELSRVRKLGAVAAAAALAAGVPAAAVPRIALLHHDPLVAIPAVLLYEVILVSASFMFAVSANLRSRWVARAADAIDSWIRRKVSPFTRAYLRYVQALTRYMDTRGISTAGPHILEMADVQVTLSLVAKPLNSLTSDPIRHHIESEAGGSQTIWHWLNEAHRKSVVLSVIGPPGSGKSTLLRHVAFTLAKGQRSSEAPGSLMKIPVLVNLREHNFSKSADVFNLADIVRRSLVALDCQEPPSWVEVNLRHGKFAILLDGLDEIPDSSARIALVDWLVHQSSAQDGNLFVLTSRPFGYRENPIPGAMLVEVQPLAKKQISSFVVQWYRAISSRSHASDNESSRLAAKAGAADLLARLDRMPSLFELTANPLLLTMLVNVHYYRAGALPGSRAELYDEICDVFLAKRDQVRSIRIDIPGPQKRAGLQMLAYEMMHRGITEAKANDAASWIQPALQRMTRVADPLEFFKNIEDSAGLLIEKERDLYSFAHLTFQEYLAAEFIRETGKVEQIVSRVTDPWWRETIRLYAAISDATPVVDACLKHRSDSDLIVLAAQCADEANELDKLTRQSIDVCINPPDARDDAVTRNIAARAQLQLRASKDVSVKKSSFIGGTHVTWLEYQYFIDSLADTECLVPDHWGEGIYPIGSEREPVAGIRYSDAEKFCGWLNSAVQSTFSFRLPRSNEISRALEIVAPDGSLSGLTYWTTTQLPRSRDGRFWPLLRNASEGARHDTFPVPDRGITTADLGSQIGKDLKDLALSRIPAGAVSETGFLPALINRCWEDFTACDVSQMQRDIDLAQHLVQDYARYRLADEPGRMKERLQALADQLRDVSAIVLDRTRYSQRTATEMRQMRETSRKSALEAAVLCIALHAVHGAGFSLPPLEKVTRPSRKVPNPSRQPTVIVNILAHAFLGIYIDYCVLAARISGRMAPAESVVYVRETPESSRAEQGSIGEKVQNSGSYRPARMPFIKRAVDIVASTAALTVLAPLMLVLGLAIKLYDGGPALFTQVRVGKDGRVFRIYKFRTMVVDADRRRAELLASDNVDGVLFKMQRDPRVTAFGAILRKWSVDELPQLFNVLLGNMSLVGPRPALPEEAAVYAEHVRRRLVVTPGVTGLWQVNGRSDLSWDESVRLDLRYIENWSLALDMQILWKTFAAILRGSGAY